MKRSKRVMGLVILVAVMLVGAAFVAQQPVQTCAAAARLPDFVIKDIYLTADCHVAVVVKNLGPGPVPDEVWTVHHPKSAGVYLYRNGTGWGGGTIWGFDPAKNLQPPGGTATYVSKLKVSGTEAITAVVDLWDVVKEVKEDNNKRKEKLTCKPPVGKCCIAGTYDGNYADTLSKICPRPETGKFIMDITQANCGPKIAGKVVNPANGETYKLGGKVTPKGKCCWLEGELHGVSGTIVGKVMKFEGTLCKDKFGKWYCKDGVYTAVTPPGCGGKFTLEQK